MLAPETEFQKGFKGCLIPSSTLRQVKHWRHFNEGIFIALLHEVSQHLTLLPPAHQAHKSFLKPSQLPGEYTAQLLPFRRIGLIKHNNQCCPHRYMYPFTPGWREAIIVAVGVRTHILTTQPSAHKSNALNCLAMALVSNFLIYVCWAC